MKKLFKSEFNWNLLLTLFLIIMMAVFGIKNPKFFRPALFFTGINDHLTIGIIAIFVTFVMITGGIDIQVEALVGLTSITIGVLWQGLGMNIWLAMVVAILFAGLCGLFSGFLIAHYKVQAMVITLGGSFLFSGLALLISTMSGAEAYQGISGFPDSFKFLGQFKFFRIVPLQFVIFIGLIIFAHILLNKTKYGRRVYLVGVNPGAAKYSGINTKRTIISTYFLSGLSAGIAGAILTSYLGTSKSDLGLGLTMNIITAVVLGGTLTTGGKGSVIGTALASLIIAVLKFGMPLSFRVNPQYLDIPIGVMLVIIVLGNSLRNNPGKLGGIVKLRNKKRILK